VGKSYLWAVIKTAANIALAYMAGRLKDNRLHTLYQYITARHLATHHPVDRVLKTSVKPLSLTA
jgi:hypothetical protein